MAVDSSVAINTGISRWLKLFKEIFEEKQKIDDRKRFDIQLVIYRKIFETDTQCSKYRKIKYIQFLLQ